MNWGLCAHFKLYSMCDQMLTRNFSSLKLRTIIFYFGLSQLFSQYYRFLQVCKPYHKTSLVPRPRQAFRRLQYGKAVEGLEYFIT